MGRERSIERGWGGWEKTFDVHNIGKCTRVYQVQKKFTTSFVPQLDPLFQPTVDTIVSTIFFIESPDRIWRWFPLTSTMLTGLLQICKKKTPIVSHTRAPFDNYARSYDDAAYLLQSVVVSYGYEII